MKSIFLVFGLLISIFVFSVPPNHINKFKTINKIDSLPLKWKGKSVSDKEFSDSLRVLIIKIHDSIENTKLKKIKL